MGVVISFLASLLRGGSKAESQSSTAAPALTQPAPEIRDMSSKHPDALSRKSSNIPTTATVMAPSKDPDLATEADISGTEPPAKAPSASGTISGEAAATSKPKPQTQSKSKQDQKKKENKNEDGISQQTGDTTGDGQEKVSNAELKKRAKAEKAARRAREKEQKLTVIAPPDIAGPVNSMRLSKDVTSSQGSKVDGSVSSSAPQTGTPGHKRTPSTSIPLSKQRPRPTGVGADGSFKGLTNLHAYPEEEKRVPLFGHLYEGMPRRATLRGASKDVHPSILALGLQMSNMVIVGSNARCVATLLAFKQVIRSYTTPPGISLSRHLTTHLGHQIDYLKSCRPLSVSMGNSIRWLKLEISTVDPSVEETIAKTSLCQKIDDFIRERITVADDVIAASASSKIQNGDVILTAYKSSIVEKTLLYAKQKQNKSFRVYIIDSRPLFEGKNLARTLLAAGIRVSYSFQHALGHAVREATKCFLGAHSMTSNGGLYSRAGTAMVALMAHEARIPVIVCCESIKFSERVALDSIVNNEVIDPDQLTGNEMTNNMAKLMASMGIDAIVNGPGNTQIHVNASGIGKNQPPRPKTQTVADVMTSQSVAPAKGKGKTEALADDDDDEWDTEDSEDEALENWRDEKGLTMLNPMYDLAPKEYIDLVVCEHGMLPPSSVPIVLGMSQQG